MSPRGQEKRRHVRVEERLTLRTVDAAGLGTIEMETANLSLGGATCLSRKPIPPMTRLQLSIFLPSTDGRNATLHYPVQVEAVVVRTERLGPDGAIAADCDGEMVRDVPGPGLSGHDDTLPAGVDLAALPGLEDPPFPAAGPTSATGLAGLSAALPSLGPASTRSSRTARPAAAGNSAAAAPEAEAPDHGAAAPGAPDPTLRYRLAVFFSRMASGDRDVLARFLGAPDTA
ncbi:MAG: PilZ domain-containing protein [Acidobacteriota bacterium]